MSTEDAKEISKLFTDKISGISYEYDPNVLKFNKSHEGLLLCFKTDPGKEMHIYSPGLKLRNAMRPVPGLIWRYKNRSLDIWAYKEFKGFDTELYNAPFMNVSGSNLCIGSARISIDVECHIDINEAVKNIKEGFFNSAFSHVSGTPTEGNFHELSDELESMNHFPLSMLLPVKKVTSKEERIKTVKDII